jgi:hypothetical protein
VSGYDPRAGGRLIRAGRPPIRRPTGGWRLLVGGLVLGGGASCRDGASTVAPANQWRVDSARYEAELARYVRDSLVIDSVARTIDTEPLRRLYRKMLHAQDPMPVLNEVLCERTRLATRYGLNPSELAIGRMRATLWRPDERNAVRAMENRMPATSVIGPDPSCREGPRAPYEIDGTPLHTVIVRPEPPQRPKKLQR